MKKTIIAAALMACAGSTMAADTAVLQVQGKLTAASCTPELSNGGEVDYGYIHLGSLNTSEINQLGEQNIDLTITCTAPTKAYWSIEDNVHDTNANIKVVDKNNANYEYYQFGVGLTPEGVKIGDYSVLVDAPTADGIQVDTIADNKGPSRNWRSSGAQRSDALTMMTVAKTGTVVPIAFETVVFPIKTTLAIQSTDKLAITDDTPIAGQATITLGYL